MTSEDETDNTVRNEANGKPQDENQGRHQSKPKGPSRIQKFSAKAKLTPQVVIPMVKATIPPIVAIAFYQSDNVAKQYGNQGYLIAIASILGLAIMPRARFIQSMFLNVVGICLASAVVILSLWSAIQARLHTTPKGRPPTGYNSSASAVLAVWLFFQIFLINALRSKLPQLQFPVILYAIFCNISLIYGTQFPTTTAAFNFVKTLLKCFLTGFGIATATHFIIFPINARLPIFGEMTGLMGAMRGVLDAQISYMQAFEDEHLLPSRVSSSDQSDHAAQKPHKHGNKPPQPKTTSPLNAITAKEQALKGAATGLIALLGKMQGDISFAKREIAYGKLNSTDLSDFVKKSRDVALPLLGLGSLVDIAHRVAQLNGWDKLFSTDKSGWEALSDEEKQSSEKGLEEWQKVIHTMHDPFSQITFSMDNAIEHVLLVLELKKRPKLSKKKNEANKADVENHQDPQAPGEPGFSKALEKDIMEFYDSRSVTLHKWCEQRGIELPSDSFDPGDKEPWADSASPHDKKRRGQLYVILYMEYLLYAASKALLDVVQYADSKVADGTMKKKRLVVPNFKRLRKWARQTCFEPEQIDTQEQMNVTVDAPHQVSLGDAFTKHDPEHLPPRNTLERITDYIRIIPRMLRSEHSAHGFRAACATMSIGIIAYLKDTQTFFIQQRLVWAMIMVAFSMQRTSGQAAFQFGMRILGTLLAMIASYIIWYIVDGHAAGVIVFLWLWLLIAFYIVLTRPRYIILGVLSAITCILIIGYELQVKKIGVKLSQSSGQPAYPTYELAPYRLATVAAGLAVAYFWTLFPYPVTEHSELRRDVSTAMFLLANYYTVVHETILARTHGFEGDTSQKHSPGRTLERARHKTFLHANRLLAQVRDVSSYTHWQIFVGGRFPREKYDDIATRLETIMRCTALMGYASTSFAATHTEDHDSNAEWLRDFKRMVSNIDPTSHLITNRLSLLSSCLANAHPLPPFMPTMEPLHLVKRITELDKNILSVRHLAEPGYAAFAVMTIASRMLVDELNEVTEVLKGLVGEMDFSLKCVPAMVGKEAGSEEVNRKGTRESKESGEKRD